ncbi:unnamed protein product [Vitrella brassicaformis CCMP3155]|uniref:Uncharacterized protein n=1 Tax=Vitrella brassicaformis (strain CCMP3155) TaxID=1169540 RepID=A0A0G4EIT0_VITBC|nr:unnamed protein product [Vitrella brassicaformis CCMP3155]|eukprot:CEL96599.1 unnamed protein product [Vitrella brassicaformis CCMP3155]
MNVLDNDHLNEAHQHLDLPLHHFKDIIFHNCHRDMFFLEDDEVKHVQLMDEQQHGWRYLGGWETQDWVGDAGTEDWVGDRGMTKKFGTIFHSCDHPEFGHLCQHFSPTA